MSIEIDTERTIAGQRTNGASSRQWSPPCHRTRLTGSSGSPTWR